MLSPELREFFLKIYGDEDFVKRVSKARTFEEVDTIIEDYGYTFTANDLYEAGTKYLEAINNLN